MTVCIRRLGRNRATEVKLGRFLANKRVGIEEMIQAPAERTGALAEGLEILAIQDTSELNYQAHAGRVRGLGTVGNGHDAGLFIHPLIAIDANSNACLGLAGMHVWCRQEAASEDYRQLPIEGKESYRWIKVAQAGRNYLHRAAKITVIADREADIYEEWARIPDDRTHLLIRACRDRVTGTGQSLFSVMSSFTVSGTYEVDMPARVSKRSAHRALLEVRFGKVTIKRPLRCNDKTAPKAIILSALDVRESAETVVGTEEAIHWRLLTTHQIETTEDALKIIRWYCQRWHIEQLFRTMKKQGLNIESSQVETGDALMRLAVLGVNAAVKTMQLTLSRNNSSRPASDVFNADEVEILEAVQSKVEGKTEKQKNPYQKGQLAWTSWIIARLGGWKGYRSESDPGPITMLRGLMVFSSLAQGWNLAKMCA